jgi:hypothetical protein
MYTLNLIWSFKVSLCHFSFVNKLFSGKNQQRIDIKAAVEIIYSKFEAIVVDWSRIVQDDADIAGQQGTSCYSGSNISLRQNERIRKFAPKHI